MKRRRATSFSIGAFKALDILLFFILSLSLCSPSFVCMCVYISTIVVPLRGFQSWRIWLIGWLNSFLSVSLSFSLKASKLLYKTFLYTSLKARVCTMRGVEIVLFDCFGWKAYIYIRHDRFLTHFYCVFDFEAICIIIASLAKPQTNQY